MEKLQVWFKEFFPMIREQFASLIPQILQYVFPANKTTPDTTRTSHSKWEAPATQAADPSQPSELPR